MYNVVIISAVHHSDSVIHIFFFFQILFSYNHRVLDRVPVGQSFHTPQYAYANSTPLVHPSLPPYGRIDQKKKKSEKSLGLFIVYNANKWWGNSILILAVVKLERWQRRYTWTELRGQIVTQLLCRVWSNFNNLMRLGTKFSISLLLPWPQLWLKLPSCLPSLRKSLSKGSSCFICPHSL